MIFTYPYTPGKGAKHAAYTLVTSRRARLHQDTRDSLPMSTFISARAKGDHFPGPTLPFSHFGPAGGGGLLTYTNYDTNTESTLVHVHNKLPDLKTGY